MAERMTIFFQIEVDDNFCGGKCMCLYFDALTEKTYCGISGNKLLIDGQLRPLRTAQCRSFDQHKLPLKNAKTEKSKPIKEP